MEDHFITHIHSIIIKKKINNLLLKLIYCTLISYQKINLIFLIKLSQEKKLIDNNGLKQNLFSKIFNLINLKDFKKNF